MVCCQICYIGSWIGRLFFRIIWYFYSENWIFGDLLKVATVWGQFFIIFYLLNYGIFLVQIFYNDSWIGRLLFSIVWDFYNENWISGELLKVATVWGQFFIIFYLLNYGIFLVQIFYNDSWIGRLLFSIVWDFYSENWIFGDFLKVVTVSGQFFIIFKFPNHRIFSVKIFYNNSWIVNLLARIIWDFYSENWIFSDFLKVATLTGQFFIIF